MSRFGRLEFEDERRLKAEAEATAAAELSHAVRQAEGERDWIVAATDERREGRFEEALRLYSRALELDKSLVIGWLGQVQMLIALGEYPEAELWSRKALELFRNNAELLAARAQALCRTGDLRAAQASCDAAIGQQGLFSYPWVARGELMLARHEALEEYCFDKAVQLDADWLVQLEIAAVYEHYGRHAKALVRIRRAIEQAPDRASCWYRQAECEMALGLTASAEKSYRRCLQAAPKHEAARRRLFEIDNRRGVIRQTFRRLFRRN
jgi:tetratricopeptide (TPR) repeat protein